MLPASAHYGSTSWRRWQICRRLAWCCRRTRVFFLPFSSLPYLLPCLVLCSIRRRSASAKRVAAEQVARVCVLGRRWTTWSHARRRATGAAHLIGRDTTGAHTARSLWRDTHRPLRLLLVRIHRPLRLLLMRVHRPKIHQSDGKDTTCHHVRTKKIKLTSTTVACWAELRAAIVALANAWVVAVADVAGLRHCWA